MLNEIRIPLGKPSIGKERLHRRPFSKEHKQNISNSLKGLKRSEEFCRQVSLRMKGNIPWNKGKKVPHSESTKQRISLAKKGTRSSKRTEFKPGDKSPCWKGGISFLPYCDKFNNKLKEIIRERDNRTCQLCGTKENGEKLSIHHIHHDKENCNPDLISLCRSCHSKIGHNTNYYEQILMSNLERRGII